MKNILLIFQLLLAYSIAFSQDISPRLLETIKQSTVKIDIGDNYVPGIVVGYDKNANMIFMLSSNHVFHSTNKPIKVRFYNESYIAHSKVQIIDRNRELGIIVIGVTVSRNYKDLWRYVKRRKLPFIRKLRVTSAICIGHTRNGDWEHASIEINQPDLNCKGVEDKRKFRLSKVQGTEEGYYGGAIFVVNHTGIAVAGIRIQNRENIDGCEFGVKLENIETLFSKPFPKNFLIKGSFLEVDEKCNPNPEGDFIVSDKGTSTIFFSIDNYRTFETRDPDEPYENNSRMGEQYFDFDTGVVTKYRGIRGSKSDIFFDKSLRSTKLEVRGSAGKGIAILGVRNLETITYGSLVTREYHAIDRNHLSIDKGTVIAVKTDECRYAKLKLTEITKEKVTFDFVVYESRIE